jgi:hypothetical protein
MLGATYILLVLPHEFFAFFFIKGIVFFLVLALNTDERYTLSF